MKEKKRTNVVISAFLIFSAVTVVTAGITMTLPPIPRRVLALNRTAANPLVDSVIVKCNQFLDPYYGFTANASIHAICPGFNVMSMIRWDWSPGGRMAGITFSKQVDGDQRDISRRVRVFDCGIIGWNSFRHSYYSNPLSNSRHRGREWRVILLYSFFEHTAEL